MRAVSVMFALSALVVGCPGGPGLGGNNGGFPSVPDPDTAPCVVGGESLLFLEAGLLEGATHYDCVNRTEMGGDRRFISHSGVTTLVAGGSSELQLGHEGWLDPQGGALVILEVDGERGHFATTVAVDPEVDDAGELHQEFFVRSDAEGGLYTVRIGFDDGTGTPAAPNVVEWYEIDFQVIETVGGALQFALNWNRPNDMDLHVIEPNGEMVYYANPVSSTGGTLDLDSNAGCTIDNVNNENVIWDADVAPEGEYQIGVNLWSACTVQEDTEWRLTILVDGVPVETVTGTRSPGDELPEADPLPLATTFTYTPVVEE